MGRAQTVPGVFLEDRLTATLNIIAALRRGFADSQMGLYAEVLSRGAVADGDRIVIKA